MHNKAIIALVGAVGALNVKPAVSKDQYLSQVDAEADAEFLEDWFWGFSQVPDDQYLSQVDAEAEAEFDLFKAFQDLGLAIQEVFTTGDFEEAGHIIANTQKKKEEKQEPVVTPRTS